MNETPDVRETLSQRQARYGTFMDNALLSNAALDVFRAHKGWANFKPDQRTATELIMQKLARAVSGDADYDDNWRDIAGYAQLIVDRINGTGVYQREVFPARNSDGRCLGCGAPMGHAHQPDCAQLQDPSNPG